MTFASEEALCAAFAAAARADGWTVYPETGFDLLLVRRGVQVGVEAKLLGGFPVLLQALPAINALPATRRKRIPARELPGPHLRAILVGRWPGRTRNARIARANEVYALAAYLRVVVLEPPDPPNEPTWLRVGWRRNLGEGNYLDALAYRWRPRTTVWTPPFVPNRPAGVPSPSSVGPWQLAAVALDLRAVARGWVSIADAREVSARFDGRWNPRTLLARYFRSTTEVVGPGDPRARRWVPNRVRRPVDEWSDVAAYLRAQRG